MLSTRADRIALGLILAAFLLLGGLMALGALRYREAEAVSAAERAREAAAAKPRPVAEPAWRRAPRAKRGAVKTRSSRDARSGGDGRGASPASVVLGPPAPRAAPKPVPPAVVRLAAARGDCWVEVRKGSESGPVLFTGIIASGQVRAFRGKRLWLRLGAPQSVDASIDGRQKKLPGGTLNMVATRAGFTAAD